MHSRISTMKRTAAAADADASSKMLPRGVTTRSKARAEATTAGLAPPAAAGKLSASTAATASGSAPGWANSSSSSAAGTEDVQPLNDGSGSGRRLRADAGSIAAVPAAAAATPGRAVAAAPAAPSHAAADPSAAGRRLAGSGNSSNSSCDTSSSSSSAKPRRVSFGPGPLSREESLLAGEDGHPVGEGLGAAQVRRLPSSYALDLTRGNVLMLENLLGQECVMSITRLKRRVGLLPPIRAPRPHATNSQSQQPRAA